MVSVRFYPLDIDYRNKIRIFGKTESNKRIVVLDDSIKPFFYILPKSEDCEELKNKIDEIIENEFLVIKSEVLIKDYLGKDIRLIKVYVNNEEAINVISDNIKKNYNVEIFEHDIPIYKKYLIERDITPLTLCEVEGEIKIDPFLGTIIEGEVKSVSKEDFVKPKILAFDIEILSPESISSEEYSEPIISISFAGSDGFRKVLTWKEFNTKLDYVEFTNSESDLIIKFKKYVEEINPDYIVGYFSDGFDFPYIIKRAERYGISLDLGLDNSKIRVLKGNPKKIKIKGIIHIDIFQFIKKIMAGSLKLDSYSLDSVAGALLQERKKDLDIWKINNIWDGEKDIEKLCEYNLHDSVLTLKIFEKILPNLNELVKITNIPIFDLSRMSYGHLIENYLIKKSKLYNILIPNLPSYNQLRERRYYTYQGAYVMEPNPGFYKNLVVFDFMSLYPTIIISKNICPSTFNKEKKGNKSPLIIENGKEEFYYFEDSFRGFIPKVLEEVITKRIKIKELLKTEKNPILQARSYALKTIGNSCYGYMGFFGARWYCKQCVSSITAWARDYIKGVINQCNAAGFNVIYSDTDSIAIELKNKKREEIIKFIEEINRKLPGLMEIELEDFYPYGIFVAKKRETHGAKKKYALIDGKGEIKISGFETVRKDWSKIARETQKKVLEIILKENSPESAKKYVISVIENLREKKILVKDLVIQTQLKMNLEAYEQIGPHVAVARKMKEKGYKITKGSPIWFVVTEGKGMIRDRSKIPEEVKEGSYDIEYYINNQVIPSVEKIFEVFNIKKEELVTMGKQTNLESF